MKSAEHLQIKECINNYQWLLNEYKRIAAKIEAPEASKLLMSIQDIKPFEDQRSYKLKKKYSDKIAVVHRLMDNTMRDIDYAVMNCLTDGMTATDTAKHLNISRGTIYNIIDQLIANELKMYRRG